MANEQTPALRDVLTRLKERVTENPKIFERSHNIHTILMEMVAEQSSENAALQLKTTYGHVQYWQEVNTESKREHFPENPTRGTQQVDKEEKKPPHIPEYLKDKFEDTAAAYLLYQINQQSIDHHRRFEIRDDQIEAIASLLEKSHLQTETGTGKSSVVLPVAAIVKALSSQGEVAVATVSPELAGKMEKNLADINNLLPKEFQTYLLRCEDKKPAEEQKPDMVRAFLDEIIEGQHDKLIDEYHFRSLFDYTAPTERYTFRSIKKEDEQVPKPGETQNIPKGSISLFTDDQLVFWKVEHPETPLVHTYIDEVHILHGRGSSYVVEDPGTVTKSRVEAYLTDRIASGIIAKYIDINIKENFIQFKGGTFDFTDDIHRDRFLANIQEAFREPLSQFAKEAIGVVANKLSVDLDKLTSWFTNKWKGLATIQGQGEDGNPYSEALGQLSMLTGTLLKAKTTKEGVYYSKQQDSLVPRDFMMGIELPGRQHEPSIEIAFQALNNVADYRSFQKTAVQSTTFQGFVAHNLKGDMTGLSGTLETPSLTPPFNKEKTTLTKFLERYTHYNIHVVKGKEELKKIPPRPEYYIKDEDLVNRVVNIVENNAQRPIAIHCFGETEGETLLAKLKQLYPDKQYFFINDKLNETQAQQKAQKFADAENAILISTGRVGVGVDIKKGDESFPDFFSIIDGIPFAADQLFQIMGRRRKEQTDPHDPSKDFVWLFSKNQVEEYPGFKASDKKDEKSMDKLLQQLTNFNELALQGELSALTSPMGTEYSLEKQRNAMLKIIARLVRRSENWRQQADDLTVAQDKYYEVLRKKMMDKFDAYWSREQPPYLPYPDDFSQRKYVLEGFLGDLYKQTDRSFFHRLIQVPSSLRMDMETQLRTHLSSPPTSLAPGYTYQDMLAMSFSAYVKSAEQLMNGQQIADWVKTNSFDVAEMFMNATSFIKSAIAPQLHAEGLSDDDIKKLFQRSSTKFCGYYMYVHNNPDEARVRDEDMPNIKPNRLVCDPIPNNLPPDQKPNYPQWKIFVPGPDSKYYVRSLLDIKTETDPTTGTTTVSFPPIRIASDHKLALVFFNESNHTTYVLEYQKT